MQHRTMQISIKNNIQKLNEKKCKKRNKVLGRNVCKKSSRQPHKNVWYKGTKDITKSMQEK